MGNKKKNISVYVQLHLLLLVFSFSGVFSKLAGQQNEINIWLFVYGGALLLVLFVYALGWQQVIKKLPLTEAYMNRAIIPLWTLIWGILLFGEKLNAGKIAAVICIVIGVVLFSSEKSPQEGNI